MNGTAAKLFLYGSLKRGYSNHAHVTGQRYLGDARTAPRYRIIQLGRYGGLIRDDAAGLAVKGELWAVDTQCLADLDEFEMGEGLWARFPVEMEGGGEAQAYFWTGAIPADVRSSDEWPFA